MNGFTHLRLAGLLVSAAAFAAAGAPSTAFAGASHHISVYKVEQHVDLEGEDADYELSCDSTDIAIDGMWRIDNIDQDNDWQDPDATLASYWDGIGTGPGLTILKSVRPMSSYADAADVSKYHFQFTPLGGADVQLKLWLTCLPNPLAGAGHSHNWQFSIDSSTQHTSATATTAAPAANAAVTTATCPARTILVQPGYQTLSTDHHLVYSRPETVGPSWNARSWGWTVYSSTAGAATLTWRCLDVKSSPPLSGGSHTHKLVFNKKETQTVGGLPGQSVTERQQSCGEHYKAMLGGWDITEGYVGAAPAHMATYFLGMDPRIKTRAFKFVNLDTSAKDVTVATVCFKDRTT
jgi:hypothetical protein